MAMGPKNATMDTSQCPGTAMDQHPAMATAWNRGLIDTNQRPGTVTDQRPAMVMASNQCLTVAANQRPATATHRGPATATHHCPATRQCPLTRTTTNQGLATATNERAGTATGRRPATIIDTNQRPGADVRLGRQPIRQMKMPLRCRRTRPHLLLVDDDRRARALRLRWGIRLLREMNTVRYTHKLAHSPLCGDSNCCAGEFRESTFGLC
jgi:hypothetical protein